VKFVIGLGNPGSRYVHTRHNLGWRVLDALAAELPTEEQREMCEGLAARAGCVTLFKPLTYMNESGRAVARLASDRGVGPQDMLVVLDDLNLPLGSVRLRAGGSAGGHRGLQSVIDALGTEQVPRLRLGIGPLREGMSARQFVLSPFEETELESCNRMVERAVAAVLCWLAEGVEAAMSRYNVTAGSEGDPERKTHRPGSCEEP